MLLLELFDRTKIQAQTSLANDNETAILPSKYEQAKKQKNYNNLIIRIE
jgi:hypothetical protein